MKPKKKNNDQEKKPTSDIEKFFKSAPKTLVIDDKHNIENDINNSKAVYIHALKEKLQSFAVEADTGTKENEKEDGAGAGAISAVMESVELLSNENQGSACIQCVEYKRKANESKEWETKFKDLKKVYLQLTIHHSELDMKYHALLKTKTHTNEPDNNDAVAFNDDVFSPNQLRALQSMSLEKKSDSSFILKCLEYAYKDDLSVLRTKTLKGTAEVVEVSEEGDMHLIVGKDPLSPKKVERIKELFIERVSKAQIDAVAYGERIKDSNINKLFASGVRNIAKKTK